MRWPGNRCQRILFCGDVHRGILHKAGKQGDTFIKCTSGSEAALPEMPYLCSRFIMI